MLLIFMFLKVPSRLCNCTYTSLVAMTWLRNSFGNIIQCRFEFPWPVIIRDLFSTGLFSLGICHTHWVFKAKPDTTNSLKQVFQEVISSIDQDILVTLISKLQKRIHRCIQHQRGYFDKLVTGCGGQKNTVGIFTAYRLSVPTGGGSNHTRLRKKIHKILQTVI